MNVSLGICYYRKEGGREELSLFLIHGSIYDETYNSKDMDP